MKSLLILGVFFFCKSSKSVCQKIDWQKTYNWKLYNIHDDNAFSYSLKTTMKYKNIDLDSTAMRPFLHNVIEWPKSKTSLWMGLFVATCNLANGKTRKIDISFYGGFFYVEKTKTYYEIPEFLRDDWLKFINENEAKLTW